MNLVWNYNNLEKVREVLKDNPCSKIIYIKLDSEFNGESLSLQDTEALINKLRAMIDAAKSE